MPIATSLNDDTPDADATPAADARPDLTVRLPDDIGTPVFHISELVGAGREALIRHEGQTYRLRITSNRKLILTK
jgi:hemin uptake protein HemP